jgi:hypothetical protein
MVARRWGVSVTKVLLFIKVGELKAMNLASPGRTHKPRFLIDLEDLADFERRRTVGPPAPAAPRRRRRERCPDDYY